LDSPTGCINNYLVGDSNPIRLFISIQILDNYIEMNKTTLFTTQRSPTNSILLMAQKWKLKLRKKFTGKKNSK
jgi:hypothetical protein